MIQVYDLRRGVQFLQDHEGMKYFMTCTWGAYHEVRSLVTLHQAASGGRAGVVSEPVT